MSREITTLVPWFGSNRTLARNVGQELAGCSWVGVPFAGGMCELAYIDAPSLVASDLHRHVINLARVVADPGDYRELVRMLRKTLFHPDTLDESRAIAEDYNRHHPIRGVYAAYHYFITAWMGRSAKAGTDGEFTGKLPVRWNGNGGDSATRFRSAIRGLVRFHQVARRCNFHVMDAFDFLADALRKSDRPKHGIYVDPPFPGPGDNYKHKLDEASQVRLALSLGQFEHARVVCRFYDVPLVRKLYPEPQWTWRILSGGKKQSGADAPEVLLINGPSVVAKVAQTSLDDAINAGTIVINPDDIDDPDDE